MLWLLLTVFIGPFIAVIILRKVVSLSVLVAVLVLGYVALGLFEWNTGFFASQSGFTDYQDASLILERRLIFVTLESVLLLLWAFSIALSLWMAVRKNCGTMKWLLVALVANFSTLLLIERKTLVDRC